MARVTVEDCVDKVPNRFEPVMLAAHRAREISSGSSLTVERDNDKNPVVSLREIADETQTADELRERLIESNQTQIEVDLPEDDSMAVLMGGGDDSDRAEDDDMSEEKLLRAHLWLLKIKDNLRPEGLKNVNCRRACHSDTKLQSEI